MTVNSNDKEIRTSPFDEFLSPNEEAETPHIERRDVQDLRQDVSNAFGSVGLAATKAFIGYLLHGGTPGAPTGVGSTVKSFSIAATDLYLQKIIISGNVTDAKVVRIGDVIYEFDTNGVYTAGHIPVDVSASVAKAAAAAALLAAIQENQPYLALTTGTTSGNPYIYFTGNYYTTDNDANVDCVHLDETEVVTITLPTDETEENIVKAINVALAGCTYPANRRIRCWYDWSTDTPGYCFTGPSTVTLITISSAANDMSDLLKIRNNSTGAFAYSQDSRYKRQWGTKASGDFVGGGPAAATVTLLHPYADTSYRVFVCPGQDTRAWVDTKAVGSFAIHLSAAASADVDWFVVHD